MYLCSWEGMYVRVTYCQTLVVVQASVDDFTVTCCNRFILREKH